jgi:hypothetical protein
MVKRFNSAGILQQVATAIFSWEGVHQSCEKLRDNALAIEKIGAYYVIVQAKRTLRVLKLVTGKGQSFQL